jgi:gamma-glutamylcyclotransferase (GGCT)/AIG2-like uncharacterized protein YtfP
MAGLYFAYGSNMDPGQMAQRCPGAKCSGTGQLFGFRFALDGRGAADVIQDASSSVFGVLWHLTELCESSLDRYEGVSSGIYKKTYHEIVTAEDQGTVKALVYIAQGDRRGSPRGADYMDRIIKAATAYGLPATYISELRQWRAKGA